MKKYLFIILIFSTGIAKAQMVTCGELVKLMKFKEMSEVDDYMMEKQFLYETAPKADKKSPLKTNTYITQDTVVRIQRTFGKEASQSEMIVTSKSQEFYESIKKGAKQSAFAAKKDATGPVITMDNKTFMVDFDPTAASSGGFYKIRFYPSVKK